ncbi:MAG: hypothetical protein IJP29_04205 [Lachnospiraceae bacterium]|nr:hypothetical protein [Lachnospiraceae bacterium]
MIDTREKANYGNAMDRRKRHKHVLLGMLLVVIFALWTDVTTQAATIDFQAKVAELQVKFPHGKYWNKVGKLADNSDGYTDTACSLHGDAGKTAGVDHIYGTGGCTCNHFTGGGGHLMATQCMGFANKLGYDVFGETTWTKISSPTAAQIASIRVGDIVRLDYDGHSVFVIARTGDNIMVGEANYSGACQISWGRIINLSTANITYYERAANYDTVIGSQNVDVGGSGGTTESGSTGSDATTEQGTTGATGGETTTEDTTEIDAEFTGWKKASDGVNYVYYKEGKLQKKRWLTIKKKKYYVDKKGYRVTGFYDVNNYTYYFNNKGVLQKNQWFTLEKETYYVNADGIVLKSQWLYYKGKLVYVTEDGSMAQNEIVKIGSKQYYFNANGKRSKGFKKYKGKYYYANSSGVIQKKKWITKGGKKYYLQKNGVRAQSKLFKIGKYRYYFDAKGRMVKNKEITYKGKVYKADRKGRCKYVADVEETTAEQSTEATEQTTGECQDAQTSETEATVGDMDYVTDISQ